MQPNTGGTLTPRRALDTKRERAQEALRLYRPMRTQVPFHLSRASEILLRGGNQSGKSLSCAVEFAHWATGEPIIGPDGHPLPDKMRRDHKLMLWVIGLGTDHIGDTIYRLLFMPGQFDVIRDLRTGLLRAYNPLNPEDVERESEKEPSPPLIPERLAPRGEEGVFVWDSKGGNVFARCNLKNGNTICAYTSKGDVKQGDPVDGIWIDENIKYKKHVPEWQARLSKYKGRLIWSSWPEMSNTALRTMTKRAAQQADEIKRGLRQFPDVEEFLLRFSDNPHIDANEKRKRLEGWAAAGDGEVRARDSGEYLTDALKMYPNYGPIHWTPREDVPEDAIDKILRDRQWEPPHDWTRYLALDPGHAKPAILFCATPPPEMGNYRIIYDEIYGHQRDARELARMIHQRAKGYWFKSFLIDNRFGRQSAAGFGIKFRDVYIAAFKELGLKSELTGSEFEFAKDDVDAGIMAVRDWLSIRPDGKALLRIVKPKCPNLHMQIEDYEKTITKDVTQDKPATGQLDDFCDCLRYLAMHGCRYEPLPAEYVPPESEGSLCYHAFKNWWSQTDSTQAPASGGKLGPVAA